MGSTVAAVSLSRNVAEWAAGVSYADLPAPVVAAVRRCVVDTLGIALASTAQPFGQRFHRWDAGRTGGATALGLRGGSSAEHAALVNGVLAHGLDFDDTYQPGVVHVGAVVVPTALAVGEDLQRSSEDVVTAIALGYELATRLGEASPGAFHRRGLHATPICGAFASALVAARLMGHSVDETVAALGIVGSFAAGIQEFLRDGTDTKRLHPGWAASSGVNAARLAGIGFEGPAAVWEGHYGLYATHVAGGDFLPERVTAELGSRWNILEMSVKPYPCCHLMHAHIDAARQLRARGVRAQDVASATASIHESGLHLLAEPIDVKRRPTTTYGAQFSLPFAVAVGLADDEIDLRSFSAARLKDPTIRAVAERVTCELDTASRYPTHFDGALSLTLHDGRMLEHRESVNRGSPDRPLTDDELQHKFVRNAAAAGIRQPTAATAARGLLAGSPVLAILADLNDRLSSTQEDGTRAVTTSRGVA